MRWRSALRRRSRSVAASILLLAGAGVLAATTGWSDRVLDQQMRAVDEPVELIYLPPATFLKVMSLGYQHALANLLWFRTISYFGKHYRSDRVYPWLAHMCDAVTDLDPQADHVYRFAGFILPWEADRVDDGIALLEKGVRNIPDSWELPYMLGFSYYFFKDDLAASTRWLRAATLAPGAPEFVSRLASIIYAAHHGPGSAIDFLVALERNSVQEEVRDAIRQRIRELELARDIDGLEEAVRVFNARFQRMPADFGELVAVGIISGVPAEPFGGMYRLDTATGHVQSTLGHQPPRLGSSKRRESILKGQRPGD